MATPKKKLSKSKTRVRRKIWKNKAKRQVPKALNWASLLLKNLQTD